MAEHGKEAAAGAPSHAAGAESSSGSGKALPILSILNSVAILGAIGFYYYTNYIFKRPLITEDQERKRLEEVQAEPVIPVVPGYVSFDPIAVNIEPAPDHTHTSRGALKTHFVRLGFSLELRNKDRKDVIDEIRPLLIDKLIQTLGKKTYLEMTTVQGRYILHTQILDFTNQLITHHSKKPVKESLVTNVYFSEFVVQ